jgi:hypothetical protein
MLAKKKISLQKPPFNQEAYIEYVTYEFQQSITIQAESRNLGKTPVSWNIGVWKPFMPIT